MFPPPCYRSSLGGSAGDRRLRFHPWVQKIPWRRAWPPTPVFLPEKCHRQRSLEGYSQWGCKKSDTTEHLSVLEGVGICLKFIWDVAVFIWEVTCFLGGSRYQPPEKALCWVTSPWELQCSHEDVQ